MIWKYEHISVFSILTAISSIYLFLLIISILHIFFFAFHTDTRLSVRALLETVVAEALVTPFQVNATAVLAEAGVNGALVDVLALVCHPYLLVAWRTNAYEGADQILALESAIVRRRCAFVDV